MREIKFRTWNSVGREMNYVSKVSYFGGTGFYDQSLDNGNNIWMQYTELHDDEEDQNELYEGDIVEIEHEGEKFICLIEFAAGTFLFTNDNLPDGYIPVHEFVDYDHSYGWVNDCRLLGNKYENPEILKGAGR